MSTDYSQGARIRFPLNMIRGNRITGAYYQPGKNHGS